MKRLAILFVFCGMLITAMADWTYGTASFKGNQPSSSMSCGSVRIWYNGSLTKKAIEGELKSGKAQVTSALSFQRTTMAQR